jgi:hypothetical protein
VDILAHVNFRIESVKVTRGEDHMLLWNKFNFSFHVTGFLEAADACFLNAYTFVVIG